MKEEREQQRPEQSPQQSPEQRYDKAREQWRSKKLKAHDGAAATDAPAAKNKRRDDLAELNNEHCVGLDGAKAWVLHFETIKHKIDDYCSYSYQVPIFLRKGDFCTMYENRFKRRGQDFVGLGKWWLQHSKRRQFFGVVYEPSSPAVVDDGRGKLKLNLWTGGAWIRSRATGA